AERRERDRERIAFSATPAGAAVEELRTRRAEHEERRAVDPIRELVDEVEEIVVRPVQVLEDEDERALLRKCLEEPSPGPEALAPPIATELALRTEPDERPELRFDPRSLVLADQLGDRGPQLRGSVVCGVCLEDSELRFDHLGQ